MDTFDRSFIQLLNVCFSSHLYILLDDNTKAGGGLTPDNLVVLIMTVQSLLTQKFEILFSTQ